MLGVGWTEMVVIGVVALIVIGPKDLPVVMQRLGRMIGMVRRMGTDFQRELSKTTGFDQVTDLRRSLTEPLKQTSAEIAREFNAMTSSGNVTPTGALKPEDPQVESVYSTINKAAGLTPPAVSEPAALPEMKIFATPEAEKPKRAPRKAKAAAVETAAVEKPAAPKKAAAAPKAAAAKGAPAKAAAKVDIAAIEPTPEKPAAKPRAKKA
jgi:sec-independent protein translocase protein TatB